LKPLRFHWRNLARHGVEAEEIRQCFSNRHLLFRNPQGGKKEYKVIGKTDAGQFVEFVYEDKGEYWFVFHAMPARLADIKLYRRKVR
jgi:hypothetical protein